jgi:YggT family protein
MDIVSTFISSLAWLLNNVLWAYMWIIIFRALISWVNPDPYNPIVQFLYKVTEPVLYPIRRMMGAFAIGIDLSPLIAILMIAFLQRFLVTALYQLAYRFG